MSIETFSPLPLNTFGTWVTLLDPSDVPPRMSPSPADVQFFPGGVRTRPGLASRFPVLGGAPQINGLKTYITTNLVERLLVLDSLSNFYKESSPGVLSLVSAGGTPNLYLASTTHFGREYMAFADGLMGRDIPRQYDDVHFDRVSQIGPAEGPAVADAADAGNISPGVHQCSVIFVTRQGYWTVPSPPVSWTAAGSKKVNVTNIPTGPSNVVQRLLAFTAEGGASFYQVPATMTINDDNTTTSLEVDFSDTILLSGVSMDYLFAQIELPNQLGVVDYVERLFWWGERAKMFNWRNLTFDGGWDAADRRDCALDFVGADAGDGAGRARARLRPQILERAVRAGTRPRHRLRGVRVKAGRRRRRPARARAMERRRKPELRRASPRPPRQVFVAASGSGAPPFHNYGNGMR